MIEQLRKKHMYTDLSPFYQQQIEKIAGLIFLAEKNNIYFKTLMPKPEDLEELRIKTMNSFQEELHRIIDEIQLSAKG